MLIRLLVLMSFAILYSSAVFADKKGGDGDWGQRPGWPNSRDYYRLECRFHNTGQDHDIKGHREARFCYATAVYRLDDRNPDEARLGIGCDHEMLYNDRAWIQSETTLDRISAFSGATPAVEIFPQGRLLSVGTYTSVLDTYHGRIMGLCYVRKISNHRDLLE